MKGDDTGVPICTIAYGTEEGYVDLDGTPEPVPVDREEMKRIAAATNGEFTAATADQLKMVSRTSGPNVGYEKAYRELTAASPVTARPSPPWARSF